MSALWWVLFGLGIAVLLLVAAWGTARAVDGALDRAEPVAPATPVDDELPRRRYVDRVQRFNIGPAQLDELARRRRRARQTHPHKRGKP